MNELPTKHNPITIQLQLMTAAILMTHIIEKSLEAGIYEHKCVCFLPIFFISDHCKPDVRQFERRSVVSPVPRHGHHLGAAHM